MHMPGQSDCLSRPIQRLNGIRASGASSKVSGVGIRVNLSDMLDDQMVSVTKSVEMDDFNPCLYTLVDYITDKTK